MYSAGQAGPGYLWLAQVLGQWPANQRFRGEHGCSLASDRTMLHNHRQVADRTLPDLQLYKETSLVS